MRTIIKADGLVDVENGRVLPAPFVVVEAGTIRAVGNQADLPAAEEGCEVIDLPGHTLLPGLINSHVHLCFPGDGTPLPVHARETDAMWLLTAARNARTSLLSGVTTVRDCGDRHNLVFELRRVIESGQTEGCGIVQSGAFLTMTGGHGHPEGCEVDGADEMITAVRRRFKQGADFIKVMATGGGTPGTYPEHASFSVHELAAAADTAHRIGKTVSAHCRGIPGIRNAVDAGIDQIEHCCFELPGSVLRFDAVLADRIAAAGIVVTPTIQLYRDLVVGLECKDEDESATPDRQRQVDILQRCVEEKLRSLEGLLAAGVTCVAGNDAGLPLTPFGRFWQELDAMVAGGMRAMQAIQAATCTAARAMGCAERIGAVRAGCQADIIAVAQDPTRDVRALADPSFVMRAGRVHRHVCGPAGST